MSVARDRSTRDAYVERSNVLGEPTRAVSVKGFPLGGGRVGLAIEDVTAQTIERRLQAAEHRVLEMIASGAPLRDALDAIILAIEEYSPPCIGSILLLDPDGVHLRHGAAPHLSADYWQAIDGGVIGPQEGSCGAAAFLKVPVFIGDIETDPIWERYRDAARTHGLRACWSIPIFATDARVLGTFAFYYDTPRMPAPPDVEVTARASRLAGIAIERKELEEKLRNLSAHVEAALEEERTGIAREIHDELGQSLTALKMDIAWIVRRLAPGSPSLTNAALLERLAAMSELTDGVIQRVRRISAELRPGVLDDLGLVAAIEWQAGEFEQRTGTPCVVRANPIDGAVGGTPLDRDLPYLPGGPDERHAARARRARRGPGGGRRRRPLARGARRRRRDHARGSAEPQSRSGSWGSASERSASAALCPSVPPRLAARSSHSAFLSTRRGLPDDQGSRGRRSLRCPPRSAPDPHRDAGHPGREAKPRPCKRSGSSCGINAGT